ncbi:TetR/AcrR family transcriptional regulator [Microvirga yunnanensis]|uniref:TetR/AcrR family transcriptional regulator n=1 Tax=Microvirga yunnanensis TaxID=2953740 RepID=UPI0021C9B8CA|nr:MULTISPECIES: TetR/AcrR family transcriptional regulator [unclassified Microvirga]
MPNDNPPHSDKRPHDLRSTLTKRQILDGARQVFLLNGYAGTSIDQIINQSGVSKGSIYHHFDSKDALFRALIAAEAERIARALPSVDQDDPDPCSALRQIGLAVLETLNNPATIATLRLIIGALGRFPGLGEEFLRNSLGQTAEQIAAYLDLRASAGSLRIRSSRAAAEEFARQFMAHVMERVLVPHKPCLTEAECTAVVEDILRNSDIRRDTGRTAGEQAS